MTTETTETTGTGTIISEIDSSSAEVTPHLRWHKGILQQGWMITHYKAGVPHKRTTQWRDVPTEDGP